MSGAVATSFDYAAHRRVSLNTAQFAAALCGRGIPKRLADGHFLDSRRADFSGFGMTLPTWHDFTIGVHLLSDRGGNQVVLDVIAREPVAYDVDRELDGLHIEIRNAGRNVKFPDQGEQAECAARGLSALSGLAITDEQVFAAIYAEHHPEEAMHKEELPPVGCRITSRNEDGLHHVTLSTPDAAYRWPLLTTEPTRQPKAKRSDDPSGIVCSRVADIEAKPIRWLWRGRIARGKVTLIAGHPGLGKSQAVLSLAAIVTVAGKWPLGDERAEGGSVVILSAEDDAADTIRPRLEAAGADISRVHIFHAVRDHDDKGETRTRGLNLATDIARIAAKLSDLGDVALLVIDPVSAYLGDADSHKNADVRALLAPLADMASRQGVAVVLITHLAKNASAEALLRVQGSIAFAAAARAAWGVARDKDTPSRRLFLPLKNNIGTDQAGLAFAVEGVTLPGGIETSRVIWECEPVTVSAEEAFAPDLNREDRTAVEEAKEFLAGLLADGPVRSRQVRADAEGAGHHWSAIRRAQAALGVEAVKEGLKGGWTWRLPPKMLK